MAKLKWTLLNSTNLAKIGHHLWMWAFIDKSNWCCDPKDGPGGGC